MSDALVYGERVQEVDGGGSRPIRGQGDPGLSCSSAMRSDRNLLAEVSRLPLFLVISVRTIEGSFRRREHIDEGGCGDLHYRFREIRSERGW